MPILLNHLDPEPKDQEFDLQHAQAILDHCRLNPPASWKLNDPNYELKNGKIVLIQTQEE
jgi:hypothetical protein